MKLTGDTAGLTTLSPLLAKTVGNCGENMMESSETLSVPVDLSWSHTRAQTH
jgi:hypothetical protein